LSSARPSSTQEKPLNFSRRGIKIWRISSILHRSIDSNHSYFPIISFYSTKFSA
jgi:hypothetical protein